MATVVEAIGSASASLSPDNKRLARVIEMAMAQAVQDCVNEGVSLSDSETIKARMMTARANVKASLISGPKRSKRTTSPKRKA